MKCGVLLLDLTKTNILARIDSMKAYLIKASAPGPFKEYKKYMGAPPQNIFAMAACTPKSVTVDMCDETVDMKPKLNTDADIVVLLFHTPDALHAYRLADKYRQKGKTVVLGGLHPSFMPDETATHADALLLGEVEGIWEELLTDYQAGKLKKRYKRSEPVDPASLQPYPTDIIPPSRYNDVWSVLVSRGCVHRCEYCVVPPFFRGKYRLRPVEQVVAEIKAAPTDWFELHADNLTADRDYAIKLFKALKPLGINWMGESTIKMAEDDELLQLAQESGCKYLLIGIETPSQAALDTSGKGFVDPKDIRDRIRRFHAHGIQITSSMIFGFDTHTKDIFRESLEFCREIEIDEVESVILAPFPGTPLYQRMVKEGRILSKDWAKYDCSNVVFQPKNMTPEELDAGATWFWTEIQKDKPASSGKPSEYGFDGTSTPSAKRSRLKWKSLLALTLIALAIGLDQYWLWGVLFVAWAGNDLKSRRTYLMEDIPRSESPILYWVVVTLWLFLALWALSYAPVVQDFIRTLPSGESRAGILVDEPEKSKVRLGIKEQTTPQSTVPLQPAKKQPHTRTITYKDASLSIAIPDSWKGLSKTIADGKQLDLEAPSGRATLTCVVLDMQKRFKRAEFIDLMEEELSADLPFVKAGNGNDTDIALPNTIRTRLKFREYTGNLGGEPLRAIVGYGVEKRYGYMFIGVHGVGDDVMKNTLNKSLKNLILNQG